MGWLEDAIKKREEEVKKLREENAKKGYGVNDYIEDYGVDDAKKAGIISDDSSNSDDSNCSYYYDRGLYNSSSHHHSYSNRNSSITQESVIQAIESGNVSENTNTNIYGPKITDRTDNVQYISQSEYETLKMAEKYADPFNNPIQVKNPDEVPIVQPSYAPNTTSYTKTEYTPLYTQKTQQTKINETNPLVRHIEEEKISREERLAKYNEKPGRKAIVQSEEAIIKGGEDIGRFVGGDVGQVAGGMAGYAIAGAGELTTGAVQAIGSDVIDAGKFIASGGKSKEKIGDDIYNYIDMQIYSIEQLGIRGAQLLTGEAKPTLQDAEIMGAMLIPVGAKGAKTGVVKTGEFIKKGETSVSFTSGVKITPSKAGELDVGLMNKKITFKKEKGTIETTIKTNYEIVGDEQHIVGKETKVYDGLRKAKEEKEQYGLQIIKDENKWGKVEKHEHFKKDYDTPNWDETHNVQEKLVIMNNEGKQITAFRENGDLSVEVISPNSAKGTVRTMATKDEAWRETILDTSGMVKQDILGVGGVDDRSIPVISEYIDKRTGEYVKTKNEIIIGDKDAIPSRLGNDAEILKHHVDMVEYENKDIRIEKHGEHMFEYENKKTGEKGRVVDWGSPKLIEVENKKGKQTYQQFIGGTERLKEEFYAPVPEMIGKGVRMGVREGRDIQLNVEKIDVSDAEYNPVVPEQTRRIRGMHEGAEYSINEIVGKSRKVERKPMGELGSVEVYTEVDYTKAPKPKRAPEPIKDGRNIIDEIYKDDKNGKSKAEGFKGIGNGGGKGGAELLQKDVLSEKTKPMQLNIKQPAINKEIFGKARDKTKGFIGMDKDVPRIGMDVGGRSKSMMPIIPRSKSNTKYKTTPVNVIDSRIKPIQTTPEPVDIMQSKSFDTTAPLPEPSPEPLLTTTTTINPTGPSIMPSSSPVIPPVATVPKITKPSMMKMDGFNDRGFGFSKTVKGKTKTKKYKSLLDLSL